MNDPGRKEKLGWTITERERLVILESTDSLMPCYCQFFAFYENRRICCHSDMGIPIPKTLVMWASPVILTLTQIAKVI